MKKRITFFIEEELLSQTKRLAGEEGRHLSAVIQDALACFLDKRSRNARRRQKAYRIFCEQPMRISKKQMRDIIRAKT